MRLRLSALLACACALGMSLAAPVALAQEEPSNCPKPLTPEQCAYDPGDPPPPTPKPATPKPATPKPSQRPAPAPTRRPATTTRQPTTSSAPVVSSAPEATPFDLDLGPIGTPEIVVQGPVIDDDPGDDEQTLEAEQAAAGGGAFWIGLLIGLIVGGLVGRASWGLQRRRRQQIFG